MSVLAPLLTGHEGRGEPLPPAHSGPILRAALLATGGLHLIPILHCCQYRPALPVFQAALPAAREGCVLREPLPIPATKCDSTTRPPCSPSLPPTPQSSELRYQQQVEGLQRQLLAATRQRWREDLGLDGGADGGDDPHASRPAKRQHQQQHTPAAGGAAAAAGARAPQPPPAQPGGEDEGEEEERRREAEELLLRARAPDEVQLEEQPKRQEQAGAWVSVGVGDGGGGEAVDPYGRDPAFAVQHVERLVVEDTALGVLPEVARLLELQRRLMGRGVGEQQ